MNLTYLIDVASKNPNVAAFLLVVRACEGTAGENGYQTLFGGSLFYGYIDHPRQIISASGYDSSAAGAYQILSRTWDDYVKAVGPSDFSPASQDRCAVWLIYRRGALEDVLAGRLDVAIAKCNKEWASLPGSPYGQPVRTLEYCHEVYNRSGGSYAVAAPIEERVLPPFTEREQPAPVNKEPAMGAVALPLLAQLIPQVLALFSGRAQATIAKATGASPDVAAQFMQSLMGQIGGVVGLPVVDNATAVQAVAALTAKQDPAQVKALEDNSLDYLEKLGPLLDKLSAMDQSVWAAEEVSRDAAARRGASIQDSGPIYGNPQFLIACFILTLVSVVVGAVLFKGGFSTDMQAFVIGAVVGTALTNVLSFFFGSSRSSSGKDVVIAQMAKEAKR